MFGLMRVNEHRSNQRSKVGKLPNRPMAEDEELAEISCYRTANTVAVSSLYTIL